MLKKIFLSFVLFSSIMDVQAWGLVELLDKFSQLGFYTGAGHIFHAWTDYLSIKAILKPSLPAGPYTQQFIENLFSIYYPEIDIERVQVRFNQNSPQVPLVHNNNSGVFLVVVPIADRTLLWSLNAYLQSAGQELISIPDEYWFADDDGRAVYYPEDQIPGLAQQRNWPLELFKQEAYRNFKYIDAALFPTYVGLLLHEGAHILHNDLNNRLLFCSIPLLVHMVGAAGWALAKDSVPQEYKAERVLTKMLARSSALGLSFLLGRMIQSTYQRHYMEAAADQEAAKRIDSEIVSQALVGFFKGLACAPSTCFSTVCSWLSLDTHPANIKRSDVFVECTKNIQDDNDVKFEKLIELTCNQFRNCEVPAA